jgi:hypothetical protein
VRCSVAHICLRSFLTPETKRELKNIVINRYAFVLMMEEESTQNLTHDINKRNRNYEVS